MTMQNDAAPGAGAGPTPAILDDGDAGLVDRRADMAVNAVVLAFAIGIIVTSGGLRQGSVPDPIGPGGWPRLLAGVLAVVTGALIVRRLASWRQSAGHLVPGDGGKDDAPHVPSSNIRPFFLIAVGAAWMVALPTAGYLITTFAASVAGVTLMRARGWIKLVLVPFLFTVGTWLLFGQVFGIRFPNGPAERVLLDLIPHLR